MMWNQRVAFFRKQDVTKFIIVFLFWAPLGSNSDPLQDIIDSLMDPEKLTQKDQQPLIPPPSERKPCNGSKGAKRKLSIEKQSSKPTNSPPASNPSKNCDPPRKKHKKDKPFYRVEIGKNTTENILHFFINVNFKYFLVSLW